MCLVTNQVSLLTFFSTKLRVDLLAQMWSSCLHFCFSMHELSLSSILHYVSFSSEFYFLFCFLLFGFVREKYLKNMSITIKCLESFRE